MYIKFPHLTSSIRRHILNPFHLCSDNNIKTLKFRLLQLKLETNIFKKAILEKMKILKTLKKADFHYEFEIIRDGGGGAANFRVPPVGIGL